jgi:NAD(P)-dependent dehydrogenase (short-subunit alcohol dehydrogenase family)
VAEELRDRPHGARPRRRRRHEQLSGGDGGAVISVGTTATAEHFATGSNSYSAFKSAVTNWTLGQAQVLGARGVRCNVGLPRTDLHRGR